MTQADQPVERPVERPVEQPVQVPAVTTTATEDQSVQVSKVTPVDPTPAVDTAEPDKPTTPATDSATAGTPSDTPEVLIDPAVVAPEVLIPPTVAVATPEQVAANDAQDIPADVSTPDATPVATPDVIPAPETLPQAGATADGTVHDGSPLTAGPGSVPVEVPVETLPEPGQILDAVPDAPVVTVEPTVEPVVSPDTPIPADDAQAMQTASDTTQLIPSPSSIGEDDDKPLATPEMVQAVRDNMPADVEQVIAAIASEAAADVVRSMVIPQVIVAEGLGEPGTPSS